MFSFLTLLVLTQQNYCNGAGVCHLPILSWTRVFRKSIYGSRPNFIGSHLSTNSPDRFFPPSIFIYLFFFYDVFFFHFLSWDPMWAKISNCYSSHKSLPSFFTLLPTFTKLIFQIFTKNVALLDFVSRATVMAQASIICPSICHLGNCHMDPGQIIWEAIDPPYLQTVFLFSFFKIILFKFLQFFFHFSLISDPMGAKISKRHFYSLGPISAKPYDK